MTRGLSSYNVNFCIFVHFLNYMNYNLQELSTWFKIKVDYIMVNWVNYN